MIVRWASSDQCGLVLRSSQGGLYTHWRNRNQTVGVIMYLCLELSFGRGCTINPCNCNALCQCFREKKQQQLWLDEFIFRWRVHATQNPWIFLFLVERASTLTLVYLLTFLKCTWQFFWHQAPVDLAWRTCLVLNDKNKHVNSIVRKITDLKFTFTFCFSAALSPS